jgi:hypothetical protein
MQKLRQEGRCKDAFKQVFGLILRRGVASLASPYIVTITRYRALVAAVLFCSIAANASAQVVPGVGVFGWSATGVLNAYGEGYTAEAAADAAIAYQGYGYEPGVHRVGSCRDYSKGGLGAGYGVTKICDTENSYGSGVPSVWATEHVSRVGRHSDRQDSNVTI